MHHISEFEDVWLADGLVDPLDPRLKVDESKDMDVYYLPFDHLNKKAKIAVVSLMPGPYYLDEGVNFVSKQLKAGKSYSEILSTLKGKITFKNQLMRSNLTGLLNGWGVQDKLEIKDCEQLLGSKSHLLHITSLIRYPIFMKDRTPYNGVPSPLNNTFIMAHIMDKFVEEVKLLPNTDFIALGKVTGIVMDKLVNDGILPEDRIFTGMPNPPGGNTPAEIRYILGRIRTKSEKLIDSEVVKEYCRGSDKFRESMVHIKPGI